MNIQYCGKPEVFQMADHYDMISGRVFYMYRSMLWLEIFTHMWDFRVGVVSFIFPFYLLFYLFNIHYTITTIINHNHQYVILCHYQGSSQVAWCTTIGTPSHLWRCYNSFALSHHRHCVNYAFFDNYNISLQKPYGVTSR